MPGPTAQNLVSVARSAAKLTSKTKKKVRSPSAFTAAKKKPSASATEGDALKTYVSSITTSSSSKVPKSTKNLLKNFKAPPSSTISTPSYSLYGIFTDSLNPGSRIANAVAAEHLSTDVSNILHNELDLDWDDEDEFVEPFGDILDMSWFSGMSNDSVSPRRKEVSRERKQKWVFTNSQTGRFSKLLRLCAKRIGPDTTLEVFERLGRESGLKEYAAFINICIEEAKAATDEDAALEHIHKAHQIFTLVRENGFEIQEEMYGKFLLYLIDYGMVDEFFFFNDLIRDDRPDSLPRLVYYEMLLWLRVDNEVKIQELCHSAVADSSQANNHLREQLLLALCEGDRKKYFLLLLQTFNISEISSVSQLVSIFKSLGKFLLEPFAEKFVLSLKSSDIGEENISNLICEYAISIPNLSVEYIITKFQKLHAKLEVLPTAAQYEKLIRYSCNLHKVHEALNIVDEAFGSDVSLPLETFNSILDACIQSCELNLVHKINSMIRRHNLKPNLETFRLMIFLYVKMKDFEGAYEMISDLKKMELKPVAGMYNIILSGFYREKNIQGARNVLKQMEDEGLKPDALTFSYLIANSNNEKDIIKFYEQMSSSGIPPVKQVYMALINAYASYGRFDKAKEVALDKRIPPKSLNEIKNVLIGALASNGQLSCALKLYEDTKKTECDLDLKAIKALIEHFQSEGDLSKMLSLLEELNHSPYWVDSCFKVISYCVKQENLRFAVDLIKQLKDKFTHAQVDTEVIFDEVFVGLAQKTDMQYGLNLLKAIKEELGVSPTRKSLDFLLNACVNAKDANASFIVWKEYEAAGLPYNVLSYVRMYQALLASGDQKSAAEILSKIPRDDPHVRSVIIACDKLYKKVATVAGKKEKEKNKWKALSEIIFP